MIQKLFSLVFLVSTVMLNPGLLASEDAADAGQAVLWRYTRDRYNRPALGEALSVPLGVDPYAFLARQRGIEDWVLRSGDHAVILSEKAVSGQIPILCFHKISREENYALTPERFRRLLRYLSDEGWYLVSDYQYLQGDFSRVPTGMKPLVMGSDDASYGNVVFETRGDPVRGRVRRFFGEPVLDRDSMAAMLERFVPRENGRINFTFYMSFDAIPFRQLDAAPNPGFPYSDIPLVYEKVQYLDENFILGIHSLSHIYAYDMGVEAFTEDVLKAWEQIDRYAGGTAESLRTMAYPYGIRSMTDELRDAVSTLERNGRTLAGAFDLDGRMARPPGRPGDSFQVSRISVDNRNWTHLMDILESPDTVVARRLFIWETDTKRLPGSRYALGASEEDEIWVLVRSGEKSETFAGAGGVPGGNETDIAGQVVGESRLSVGADDIPL